MKILNSCFITIVVILSIVALGFFLFFNLFTYKSPVNEAGREYRQQIETYKTDDIETIEDVYERLTVLDSHFNSPTFDKMQGGEMVQITHSDIEILFGQPDRILEKVEMTFAHTVYQYDYKEMTISFHEEFRGISEYVIENYHATFYTSEDLDQLFFDTISKQQTEGVFDESPTREIKKNGWSAGSYSPFPVHYYDNGLGEYAPEEYLLLRFRKEEEDMLPYTLQRRYKDTYDQLDSSEEAKQKTEAYEIFKEIIDENEGYDTTERITVGDLSNAFGEIARMDYDFQNNLLQIIWLSNDDFKKEFITTMLTENRNISNKEDVNNFVINNLEFKRIHSTDIPYRTDEFIGSK